MRDSSCSLRSAFQAALIIVSLSCFSQIAQADEYCHDYKDGEEIQFTEGGVPILPCGSDQPCSPIVLLHNGEGILRWEVPESEVQKGDSFKCFPAGYSVCEGEGCKCVPLGMRYNDGNPGRFCRCLHKVRKSSNKSRSVSHKQGFY